MAVHDTLSGHAIGPASDGHQVVQAPIAGKLIELWDWPLRLFHWALVVCVSTALVTGWLGGGWMPVHALAGETIVGLLVFRISWGFFGSSHARFHHFLPTPAQIRAYLTGQWSGVGHNPLGALSVLALLLLLTAQVATGLVGNDDISFVGPLAAQVSEELSHRLTGIHHVLAKVLYGLVALHIGAIVFYLLVKRSNLVPPMIHGKKLVSAETPTPVRHTPTGLFTSVVLGLAAALLAGGLGQRPAPQSPPEKVDTPNAAPATPTPSQVTPGW